MKKVKGIKKKCKHERLDQIGKRWEMWDDGPVKILEFQCLDCGAYVE